MWNTHVQSDFNIVDYLWTKWPKLFLFLNSILFYFLLSSSNVLFYFKHISEMYICFEFTSYMQMHRKIFYILYAVTQAENQYWANIFCTVTSWLIFTILGCNIALKLECIHFEIITPIMTVLYQLWMYCTNCNWKALSFHCKISRVKQYSTSRYCCVYKLTGISLNKYRIGANIELRHKNIGLLHRLSKKQ